MLAAWKMVCQLVRRIAVKQHALVQRGVVVHERLLAVDRRVLHLMSEPQKNEAEKAGEAIRQQVLQALAELYDLRLTDHGVPAEVLNEVGNACTRLLHAADHLIVAGELTRRSRRRRAPRNVERVLSERSPGFWTAE